MEKKISVIIVTYHSEKHIYDCLDSLFKYNDIGDALEVILVDNKSSNFAETKAHIEKHYGNKIIVIENERNGGYGHGNNVGAMASTAPIIMIMNPDVRLVEPLFKQAIKAFQNPNVVQFGMKSLTKDGTLGCSMGIISSIHPFIRIPLFTICNRFGWFIPRIMYLSGACFFLRKSTFEEVGMFDERIFMYGEENDLHYRMMNIDSSYTIQYSHKLSYAHLHGLYSEYKGFDFFMARCSLKNSILIDGEKGLSRTKIIKNHINHVRLKLLKAQLLYLINKKELTKIYIRQLKEWKKELQDMY